MGTCNNNEQVYIILYVGTTDAVCHPNHYDKIDNTQVTSTSQWNYGLIGLLTVILQVKCQSSCQTRQ